MHSSSLFFVVVIATISGCYDTIIFKNNDDIVIRGIHAFVTTRDYVVIGSKGRTGTGTGSMRMRMRMSMSRKYNVNFNVNNDNDNEVNHAIPTIKSSRRSFLTTATIVTATMFSPTTSDAYDAIATSSSTSPISKSRGVLDASNSGSGSDLDNSNSPSIFQYDDNSSNGSMVTIPLVNTGQELLISYKVDDSIFKAVLDTGSPFLMIPGSCGRNTREKSGCYKNQGHPIPGLNPTTEIFDGFQGEVIWRKAYFDWISPTTDNIIIPDDNTNDNSSSDSNRITTVTTSPPQTQSQMQRKNKKEVIFGVASESIMGGPGGVFFGMIRDTDARIRPSFLGQTDVESFRVDLLSRPRTLTLSNHPLIGTTNSGNNSGTNSGTDGKDNEDDNVITTGTTTTYIPMTNILRRRYGDPVGHYTACAKSIYVNGSPLIDDDDDDDDYNDKGSNKNKKKNNKSKTTILVIFDTGVTGMVVSRSLYDEQYFLARKRKDKTLFGNVEINFDTATSILGGTTTTSSSSSSSNNEKQTKQICTLRAKKPIVTPFDPETTWKKFPKDKKRDNVHIIVMGLAFLEDRVLTVDIDKERLWVE